jgi:pimeloyl-ACP methyl ester carboxylesterase
VRRDRAIRKGARAAWPTEARLVFEPAADVRRGDYATGLLVLVHGGVGAVEMFNRVLPLLVECRRVVAVDLRAHGLAAGIVKVAEAARAMASGYLDGERGPDG